MLMRMFGLLQATTDPASLIEADSWQAMLKEIELTAPELIDLSATQ